MDFNMLSLEITSIEAFILSFFNYNSWPWMRIIFGTQCFSKFFVLGCTLFSTFFSEKAMALHSSTLAWKVPWTEEPDRLQSMGSQRVGHDWETPLSLSLSFIGEGNGNPAPVFLPGESQGRGSLVGCCLWGLTDSDTTAAT